MAYQVSVFDSQGRHAADLGKFANVTSARQAMLDHSATVDLPAEEPFHCPSLRIVEGWFIGRTEYNIVQVRADGAPTSPFTAEYDRLGYADCAEDL